MIDRLGVTRWVTLSLFLLACGAGLVACNGGSDNPHLSGIVRSGYGNGLAGYNVSLYANFVDRADGWQLVAVGSTDLNGNFDFSYVLPTERSVLVVLAERGPAMLASAIGYGSDVPANIVVNERTTVATGNAFAQFVRGRRIAGNAVGMINAVRDGGQSRASGDGRCGRRRVAQPERRGNVDARDVQFARQRGCRVRRKRRRVPEPFQCGQAARWRRAGQRTAGGREHRQVPVVPGLSQRPARSGVRAFDRQLPCTGLRLRIARRAGSCSSRSPAASTARRTAAT